MPSRQSTVPRIRVDLPDTLPYSLSPSSTLDIDDVLNQAKLLPALLAEDFLFDDVDDALYFEDGRLLDFPSFPMGRQPPLFILNSPRAQLPFNIRPDVFELGDFCTDEEDFRPLLTAPTVPRMKLVIKEQLYVQKWVDALTSDSPPKHIPWTCEKPATKTSWIAEGSIFPADKVKSDWYSVKPRGSTQERPCVMDTDRFSLVVQASHSRELYALPAASPIHPSTGIYTSPPHIRTKSANVHPSTLRRHGESKTSYASHRTVRASQPPGLLFTATSGTPDTPLAARRGGSLSCLKLEAGVIERLEYPDIPTAFRGSPIAWSPRFDTFPILSFTDHESMLLDLKSKCAVLGNGVSSYVPEPLRSQTDSTRTSLSSDEWAFARGLATFNHSFVGPICSQAPSDIAADTSIFVPEDASTPVKGASFIARLKSGPRHSMPAVRTRSSGPPGVPLPPRPALINPSTPPHVRGILKKVKSVRFEDTTSADHASPAVPPQASPERPSHMLKAVPSERRYTPTLMKAKSSSSPALAEEAPGKNTQKKPIPRHRPPPKRTKANEKPEPKHVDVGSAPEPCKPTSTTSTQRRPCQIARAKENANPVTVPRTQKKQNGFSTEVDVRRGIEGTTKSRLSTPLRNIFRFR